MLAHDDKYIYNIDVQVIKSDYSVIYMLYMPSFTPKESLQITQIYCISKMVKLFISNMQMQQCEICSIDHKNNFNISSFIKKIPHVHE